MAEHRIRRWFQFGVLDLLVVTTIVAVAVVLWRSPRIATHYEPLAEGTTPGQHWAGNSLRMKFRWCPAGEFTMGSPNDEMDHRSNEGQVGVTLADGFWLGKYEVTQGEWQAIMGSTVREQRDKWDTSDSLYGEGANYPMYAVNHDEAMEFCRVLTDQERRAGRLPSDWEYRLPTEAQWEYACRAGTKTATAFGDKLGSDQANFEGDRPYNGAAKGGFLKGATAVGSYEGNAWGFHDMHGNVWEWCRDWYQKELPGGSDPEVTTSSGTTTRARDRVARGGCWLSEGSECRSAQRHRGNPGARFPLVGFRVALVKLR